MEFPVAFEPPLKGIMAAALALSCGSRKKGFVNTQRTLFGSYSPLQVTPGLFSTRTHRAAHGHAKVLCRVPCYPSPRNLQPCLAPVTPTKQKALDSWLGSNTYRPLRIELGTSDDFKKSCLGQKESLSAQDSIRKIKVTIRQQEVQA